MKLQVTITPAQLSFAVAPGETILAAALRQGIDFPHRCRQGVCTSCVCKLTDGKISYAEPQPLALAGQHASQPFVYCCLAYAQSDVVLHHPFITG